MTIDLLSFAGGFSTAIVDKVKTLEAQALADESWDKRFQKQQDAIDKRTRGQKRRAKEEEAAEMLQTLKTLRYNDTAAAQIIAGGKSSYNLAVGAGEQALQTGADVNSVWKMTGNAQDASDITKGINDSASLLGGFDPVEYQKLYATPDEESNSYASRLAILSQRQFKTTNETEYNTIEREKQALLVDFAAFKDAERKSEGETGPSFKLGTVAPVINTALNRAYNDKDMGMTADGKMIGAFEGKDDLAAIAKLNAADFLEMSYKSIDDPVMNDSIAALRQQAMYALDTVKAGLITRINSKQQPLGKKFVRAVTETGELGNFSTVRENEASYKEGQLIQFKDKDGEITYFIYTKTLNPITGEPYY